MARLYDSLDSRELARVEHMLKRGGIEYTIHEAGEGAIIKEILVAEEDLVFAEALLSDHTGRELRSRRGPGRTP